MTALPPELGGPITAPPPPPPLTGPFLHGQSPIREQARDSQWQPVGEVEERIRRDSEREIDRLERVIGTAQRIVMLKTAPGFQQFVDSVEGLRKHAETEMVGCTAGNEQLRILQGRCQGLGSILALMRNTEHNIANLAQQLEAAKQKAASTIRPDGRVVPETAAGGI